MLGKPWLVAFISVICFCVLSACTSKPLPKSRQEAEINPVFYESIATTPRCELEQTIHALVSPVLSQYYGEVKLQSSGSCDQLPITGTGYLVKYQIDGQDAEKLVPFFRSAGFTSTTDPELKTDGNTITLALNADLSGQSRSFSIILDMLNQKIWLNTY